MYLCIHLHVTVASLRAAVGSSSVSVVDAQAVQDSGPPLAGDIRRFKPISVVLEGSNESHLLVTLNSLALIEGHWVKAVG